MKRATMIVAALALLTPNPAAGVRIPTSEDVLARARAAYATLRSYSDTGTVDYEFGQTSAPLHERHTFKTFYRAPRHFYFDFTKQPNIDRFVVWADDEAFHTWWKATGVAQTYPKGQGAGAFVAGSLPTLKSLMQLAPLLFSQAGLTGTLTEFGQVSMTSAGTLDGHPCYTLVGVASSTYPASGRVVNVRATTVWIDKDTSLVRRVFEDTTQGGPAGNVSRVTTTFEPRANPALDDAVFLFTPPKAHARPPH